jgi:hypothetical protein
MLLPPSCDGRGGARESAPVTLLVNSFVNTLFIHEFRSVKADIGWGFPCDTSVRFESSWSPRHHLSGLANTS